MSTHATIVVFDIFVFLSILLGLCTLVPAALSKSVARSPCWYNLMTAWLVYSLSYALLVGRQETPDQPPLGLCLTQTVLIYATPVLAAFATLNLYIELCLILLRLRSGGFGPPKRWRSFWLVIIPWLAFTTIIIEELLVIIPGGRLYLVRRALATNFYCHLGDSLPRTITAVIVTVVIGFMLPLQAWLAFTMYRSPNALKRLTEADRQLFIALYARLTLATLCTILAFGLSMRGVLLTVTVSDEATIAYPILAFSITLAFTTQKDILRVWLFWRPSRPHSLILFRVSESREATSEVCFQRTDQDNNHVKGGSNA